MRKDPESLEVALFNPLSLCFPPGIDASFSSFSPSTESSFSFPLLHHPKWEPPLSPPGKAAETRTQGRVPNIRSLLPHLLAEKMPRALPVPNLGNAPTNSSVSPFLPILSSPLCPSLPTSAFSRFSRGTGGGRGSYPTVPGASSHLSLREWGSYHCHGVDGLFQGEIHLRPEETREAAS